MPNTVLLSKTFLTYLVKFLFAFCMLYLGTKAIIGLSVPQGRFYSSFIYSYFNYPAWLRASLLHGSKFFLSLIGYKTSIPNSYLLKMQNDGGVHIVYSCLGYGIMSFWSAFVLANNGSWKKKLKWGLGGCLLIWSINVARISLLLLADNKHWPMPFGLDHHMLFTIAAYISIFTMIYFFGRSDKTINYNKVGGQ